jgi:gluconate 5-dehydrogenase
MLAKAAIPAMAARGHGRLIFVTSIAGHVANRNDPVYTAAKAGLTGLMRALAVDHARDGITSNALAPGMFATQTNEALVNDAAFGAFVETRVPSGRWGRPHEIGAAAVFLASDGLVRKWPCIGRGWRPDHPDVKQRTRGDEPFHGRTARGMR